jgi:hypothetical protein
VICSLSLTVSGCDSGNNSSQGRPKSLVQKVNGDPAIFVKGTKMSGNKGLPVSLFNKRSQWNYQLRGFIQENLEQTNYEDEVKEQTPVEKDSLALIRDNLSLTFTAHNYGDDLILSNDAIDFRLRKTSRNDFEVVRLETGNSIFSEGKDFKVLHISYTPDLKAFSILILSEKLFGEKALIDFSFILNETKSSRHITIVDKVYEYMYGAGVKIGWAQDTPLTISTCGKIPQDLKDLNSHSFAHWKSALIGRLELQSDHLDKCPPFSDLNVHSFIYINEWIEVLGEAGVMGETHLVPNFSTGKIIDSDIFILLGELKEAAQHANFKIDIKSSSLTDNQSVHELLSHVSLHEQGHFLGLHHKFDESIISVMSYAEKRESALTTYDKDAIQTLYDPIN